MGAVVSVGQAIVVGASIVLLVLVLAGMVCSDCIAEECWWCWCVNFMVGQPDEMPDQFPSWWGAL